MFSTSSLWGGLRAAAISRALREADVPVFGPGKAGARLEGSKLFAKEPLDAYRIPTGGWRRLDYVPLGATPERLVALNFGASAPGS